jgi:hypothetical protein
MSFGTLNLFSFFQQPNTGKIPYPGTYDNSIITSDAGKIGRTSEQNWEFPYVGTIIPSQIYAGGGAVYQIRILSDSDVGIRYGTINTILSGKLVDGGAERTDNNIILSGLFWPQTTDSGCGNLILSGGISGAPMEIASSFITPSGIITGSPSEKCYQNLIISGILSGCPRENVPIYCILSGLIQDCRSQYSVINTYLSGCFIPVNSDDYALDYKAYDFFTQNNRIIQDAVLGDEYSLDYGLSSYGNARS